MSAGRIFPAAVIAFWIASMAWLIETKVIPLMMASGSPIAHVLPELGSAEPIQDSWIIQWNDQPIGNVRIEAFRDATHGQIQSIVALDGAPADAMLSEFFGPANHLVKMAMRDFKTDALTVRLTSRMFLDRAGRLKSFTSNVYFEGVGDLFQLEGSTMGTTLRIDVNAVGEFWPDRFPAKLFTRELELPDGAFVTDAFSPPSKLTELRVGRQWQDHTYRALSPGQPLQRVQAKVTSVESIVWQGNTESVYVVELRNIGSELTIADKEVGRMWVRNDGLVLRQSLRFGNLTIVFLRDEALVPSSQPISIRTINDQRTTINDRGATHD